MTNQTAKTITTNIVPVQGIFDANGVCIGLVGPGGEFFSPPLSSDIISNATITTSTVDSTPIGLTVPSTGAFTTLSSSNVNITGGSISGVSISINALNNTPVGNITPSTGSFTTLSATTGSFTNLSSTNTITGSISGNAATATLATTATTATTATIATTATTATNLAGGTIGQFPYQTGSGATSFVGGTGVLVGGSSPLFTTTPTITGTNISGTASALNIGGNAATATLATSSTNIAGGSAYALPYQTASSTTAFLSSGTSGQILQTNGSGSAPSWVNQSSIVSGTASNIAGGTAGAIAYNSAANTTTFLTLGTSGYVLTAGASAPQYTAQSSLAVGTATNLAGGAASQIPYQTGSGATTFLANGTTGQVLTSNGSSAPTWTTPTAYATVTDDTTTNATRYPLFAAATSGNLTTEYTSSTKYQFNPSTGVLTATQFTGSGAGLTSIPNSALTLKLQHFVYVL